MKNITYLLLCCLLFICSSLHAQQTDIKGIVSDSSGEPLPGVSISIKGTTFGTITNMDGQFTIRAKKGNTLIFSFIGYQTVEQKATDTPMKVTLQESSVQVDEVVVTALGIKKEKKALAYSVTEVKSEELNRVKVSNIANSLVGKVAGVNVVKPASGVMGSSRITIRGNGSLNGSNQPLYVIDGVPMNNGNYGQAGEWGGFDAGDGISSINSEDIESMSVLKGGTAAALYGSRAANGAIVITTKKGTAGKVRVEYNMSYTKDSPILKNNDLQWEYGCGANGMNPDQLAIATGAGYGMTPEQAISQLAPTLAKQMSVMSFGSKMDGSNVTQYDGISRPYSPTARNNFKDFYDNAWSVTNNIAVSGGNEKIQFRVGAGDQRFHDMQPNSKLERNNITLNLTSRMNEHFSLKANIMYVRERAKNRPNLGDITFNANASLWQLAPNYGLSDMKITNDDGTEYEVNAQGYVINPLFVVYKNSQKDAKDRIIGSVEVQYNFTPNWYLRGRAGGDMINRRAENVTPWGTARGAVKEGNISNSAEYHGEFNTEAIAGYTNSFKDGLVSVDAFIGWNTMASWSDATSSYGDQFVVPGFNTINNTKTKSGGHSTSESYINSLFGQAEMSYKSMIYLTLTGRNDWSSSLVYADKHGNYSYFYPSVSASWLIHETFRGKMPEWISFAKIRGSWAQVGNDTDAYKINTAYSLYGIDNSYGLQVPDTYYAANLKPERKNAWEIGLDWRFLRNRIGVDFTYYKENTKDQIMTIKVPSESGLSNQLINAGNIQNQGIELAINTTPIETKDWTWDLNFTYTKNTSKIVELHENVANYITLVGDAAYGNYRIASVAEVGGEYGLLKSDATPNYDPKTGLPILELASYNSRHSVYYTRSGKVETVGSIQPDFLGSVNSSLRYKNWTLRASMDMRFGGMVAIYGSHYGTAYGYLKSSMNGVDAENGGITYTSIWDGLTYDDGIIPEAIMPGGQTINTPSGTYTIAEGGELYADLVNRGIVDPQHASSWNYWNNSWGRAAVWKNNDWFHELNYIALREVSLSYRMPGKIADKIGASGINLTLTGRNLGYLLNSLPNNFNPESLRGTQAGQFMIRSVSPYTASYTFTINATF